MMTIWYIGSDLYANLQAGGASAPGSLPSLTSSQADEDEEMMDAEDDEAGDGEEVPAAMAAAAEAVGIDLAFLQALPPELRGEVNAQQFLPRPAELLWKV